MLEPHVCHQLAHVFVLFLQLLALAVSKPHDECLSGVILPLFLHHCEDEVLACFVLQTTVSPNADEPTESPCFSRFSKPPQHIETVHLQAVVALSLQVCLSPSVEELSFYFLVHVKSNQVLVLVVFMHKVHGMSIPLTQGGSLSLSRVVTHNFDELLNSLL